MVINYNGEHCLHKTLSAVSDTGGYREVIVVDNASSDGSIALIQSQFSSVHLIERLRNDGAGAARNSGFVAAQTERIMFIDNDAIVTDQCVQKLEAALDAHPSAVFAMAQIVHDHDRNTIQFDGAGSHSTGLMVLENAEVSVGAVSDQTRKINSLITACFMMDRRRWTHEELFDEMLFYLLEDHELGLRTRLMGHEILAVPSAICYHGPGTPGMSLRQTGHYNDIRIRNVILNRWIILCKLFSLRTLVLLIPTILSFELFQLAGVIKKGYLHYWLSNACWIVRHGGELLRKRRAFQAERRSRDGQVLCAGAVPLTHALVNGRIERLGRKLLDQIVTMNWRLVRRLL